MSDAFGIDRRDITSFYFHHFENATYTGNVTDIAVSNDDGSVYNIKNSSVADDIHFKGTTIKKEDIPIAPNYKEIGSVDFVAQKAESPFGFVLYIILLIVFIVLFIFIVRTVNRIRYRRKMRKRRNQYRSLYRDDRYRYR
jgi:ATP-dependent Zn protease